MHCRRLFMYTAYAPVAAHPIAHPPIEYVPMYSPCCVMPRGGDKRSTDRTWTYIMHCFAWGTATRVFPCAVSMLALPTHSLYHVCIHGVGGFLYPIITT